MSIEIEPLINKLDSLRKDYFAKFAQLELYLQDPDKTSMENTVDILSTHLHEMNNGQGMDIGGEKGAIELHRGIKKPEKEDIPSPWK